MNRIRTAVLLSGRGSNLLALLAAAAAPDYPAEIALVLSDRPDAAGLDHARRSNVPSASIDRTAHSGRAEFEATLHGTLREHRIEIVCLAGFMRLLSPEFVGRWSDRLINIHPSLLPAFPGLHTHRRAIEAGCRVAGVTVHEVTVELDHGPILAQAAVPVLADDTPDTLAARVLAQEHRVYPRAVADWFQREETN